MAVQRDGEEIRHGRDGERDELPSFGDVAHSPLIAQEVRFKRWSLTYPMGVGGDPRAASRVSCAANRPSREQQRADARMRLAAGQVVA